MNRRPPGLQLFRRLFQAVVGEETKGCGEERGGSLFWLVDREGLERDVLADPVWQVAGQEELAALALSG